MQVQVAAPSADPCPRQCDLGNRQSDRSKDDFKLRLESDAVLSRTRIKSATPYFGEAQLNFNPSRKHGNVSRGPCRKFNSYMRSRNLFGRHGRCERTNYELQVREVGLQKARVPHP
jgi:hypothetical protein